MRIDSLQAANLRLPDELRSPTRTTGSALPSSADAATGAEAPQSFGSVLGKEVQRVNDLLAEGDVQAQRVATGDAQNLHEAMVAMSEADLALQVTLRVTQKAIAAYQEISRMQL
jgi:flagellar hook-basal body complex protein FliE